MHMGCCSLTCHVLCRSAVCLHVSWFWQPVGMQRRPGREKVRHSSCPPAGCAQVVGFVAPSANGHSDPWGHRMDMGHMGSPFATGLQRVCGAHMGTWHIQAKALGKAPSRCLLSRTGILGAWLSVCARRAELLLAGLCQPEQE